MEKNVLLNVLSKTDNKFKTITTNMDINDNAKVNKDNAITNIATDNVNKNNINDSADKIINVNEDNLIDF